MQDSTRGIDDEVYNNSIDQFIPIALHYNQNTLLTHDGHLIKVVKIGGINTATQEIHTIRSKLRESLAKHFVDTNFAFWIHVVREKADLTDKSAKYDNPFAEQLHVLWNKKNYWHDKFVNTLYVSIVYKAIDFKVNSFAGIMQSISKEFLFAAHNNYLIHAHNKLANNVDGLMQDLAIFQPSILGIVKTNAFYSDILKFYNLLISCNNYDIEVQEVNLARQLAKSSQAIYKNTIRIDDSKDSKYIAVVTIKEYVDANINDLDEVLQLSTELYVVEMIYDIGDKGSCKDISYSREILAISNDEYLKQHKPEDHNSIFCKQQIHIIILASDQETLDKRITQVSHSLSSIGLVHILEDIGLENAFWSSIPGNFKFIRRSSVVALQNTCGFSTLHSYPLGHRSSRWGNPLCILRTEIGTPFFFNIDTQNSQNACIIGTGGSGKTTLTNFIIAQSLKFQPNILYLTTNPANAVFIDAIGGVCRNHSKMPNPLFLIDVAKTEQQLEDIKTFLVRWIELLAGCNQEGVHQVIKDIVEKFVSAPKEDRYISRLKDIYSFNDSQDHQKLLNKLLPFFDGGRYCDVFIKDIEFDKVSMMDLSYLTIDQFKKAHPLADLSLTAQYQDEMTQHEFFKAACVVAILKAVSFGKNYDKMLVVIDDIVDLFSHEAFGVHVKWIVQDLNNAGCMILSNVDMSRHEQLSESLFWDDWLKSIDTKIVMSSDVFLEVFSVVFDMSKKEIELFRDLPSGSRFFVLKQRNELAVTELSIGGFRWALNALSPKQSTFAKYQRDKQPNMDMMKWLKSF